MNTITSAITFFKEVLGELSKRSFGHRVPSLVGATIIVLILAAFFAVVLGGMDSTFSSMFQYIIGRA